ncbi:MAG: hypothetical protein LUG61_05585 [Lachnospiraceae bacterium]|nr:hypothetical protein [Lachnospiraceae bacterium]
MNKKQNILKIVQLISAVALIVSVFVAIDLGINYASALVPALNDGMGFRSILHGFLRIFGDGVMQLEDFFFAFEKSLWIAFFIMVENIVLALYIRYHKPKGTDEQLK